MYDTRILVIDDEPAVCDVVAMILEDAGYSVAKATSGPEALSAIKRQLPALVILDLVMPDISGWDVYRVLRTAKKTRNIPVVLASADRDVLARARQLKANAYLGKPFQLEDLLHVVEGNLRRPATTRCSHQRRPQEVA